MARNIRNWKAPEVSGRLKTAFGSSFLEDFVIGHTPSGMLTELVQNEYDADGHRLNVEFGEGMLTVHGSGAPIEPKGWRRLGVVLGTGHVVGDSNVRDVEAKQNGIGSKNLGLRSLFLIGNRIHVSSNGKQAVLDLPSIGVATAVDRSSRGTPGVTIRVPYRTERLGKLSAFSPTVETQYLDNIIEGLPHTLIKLSDPAVTGRGLTRVEVHSVRLGRAVSWTQSAVPLKPRVRGTAVTQRRVRILERLRTGDAATTSRTTSEIEFQRPISIPTEYRDEQIAGYYRLSRQRVRIGLSVRLDDRARDTVDTTRAGIFYYPLGLPVQYTGLPIGVSAPFVLDDDRSQVLSNYAWNEWLLEQAARLFADLLPNDWFYRFGPRSYRLAIPITETGLPQFRESVMARLRTEPLWPSRKVAGRARLTTFKPANKLTVVEDSRLDQFLADEQRLNIDLNQAVPLRILAMQSGAKRFTMNSAVRLKGGPMATQFVTSCAGDEAEYYYVPDYVDAVKSIALQRKFADCFSEHWRELSDANKQDLRRLPSTVSADGQLRASQNLWIVPRDIAEGVRLPAESRLHPELSDMPLFARLSPNRKYDVSKWATDVADRLLSDTEVLDQERIAVYDLILHDLSALNRKSLARLKQAPVVRNQRGEWVSPAQLKIIHGRTARLLEPILHFPPAQLLKGSSADAVWHFSAKLDSLV